MNKIITGLLIILFLAFNAYAGNGEFTKVSITKVNGRIEVPGDLAVGGSLTVDGDIAVTGDGTFSGTIKGATRQAPLQNTISDFNVVTGTGTDPDYTATGVTSNTAWNLDNCKAGMYIVTDDGYRGVITACDDATDNVTVTEWITGWTTIDTPSSVNNRALIVRTSLDAWSNGDQTFCTPPPSRAGTNAQLNSATSGQFVSGLSGFGFAPAGAGECILSMYPATALDMNDKNIGITVLLLTAAQDLTALKMTFYENSADYVEINNLHEYIPRNLAENPSGANTGKWITLMFSTANVSGTGCLSTEKQTAQCTLNGSFTKSSWSSINRIDFKATTDSSDGEFYADKFFFEETEPYSVLLFRHDDGTNDLYAFGSEFYSKHNIVFNAPIVGSTINTSGYLYNNDFWTMRTFDDIYSHSWVHDDFSTLTYGEQETNLLRNIDFMLENNIGDPRIFFYPFGGWTKLNYKSLELVHKYHSIGVGYSNTSIGVWNRYFPEFMMHNAAWDRVGSKTTGNMITYVKKVIDDLVTYKGSIASIGMHIIDNGLRGTVLYGESASSTDMVESASLNMDTDGDVGDYIFNITDTSFCVITSFANENATNDNAICSAGLDDGTGDCSGIGGDCTWEAGDEYVIEDSPPSSGSIINTGALDHILRYARVQLDANPHLLNVTYSDLCDRMGAGCRQTGQKARVVRTDTIELSNANVEALQTTPIELVPAPGADKLVIVQSATVILNFSGAAWTEDNAPDDLNFNYDDSAGSLIATWDSTAMITAVADFMEIVGSSSLAGVATAGNVNKNVTLECSGCTAWGNAGNSTSTITVIISYTVVDVNLD